MMENIKAYKGLGQKKTEGEEEEDEGRRTNLSWGFVKLCDYWFCDAFSR